MKRIKIISLVLASAIGSSLITHHYNERKISNDSNPHAIVIPAGQEANGKPNCTLELALRFQPDRPHQANSEPDEQFPPELELHTPYASVTNTENYQRLKQQDEQVDAFKKTLSGLGEQTPLEFVQSQYEAEELDYEWAYQKEENLLALFETHGDLNPFSPLKLNCKSKNCEIIMAVEDQTQADRIYRSFLRAATDRSPENPQQSVSYFSDPENGQLIMYVSKNGSSDLFDN